jgi:hypothetical protein
VSGVDKQRKRGGHGGGEGEVVWMWEGGRSDENSDRISASLRHCPPDGCVHKRARQKSAGDVAQSEARCMQGIRDQTSDLSWASRQARKVGLA